MMIELITWLFKKYAMPVLSRYRANRNTGAIKIAAAKPAPQFQPE
ncbi:hypothetical protein [Mucilaginibacter gilvus]|nr:hypothetical protein [Mucilaginibacter gilvus]